MRKLLAILAIAAISFGAMTGCEKKTDGSEAAEKAAEGAEKALEGAAEAAKGAQEAAEAAKAAAAAQEAEALKAAEAAKSAAMAAAVAGNGALVGKWTIDLEATMAEDPKMKDMPQDQKDQAMKAAEAFMKEMSFEFTADGKAIARMGEKEELGAYTIKSTEGDTMTIEMKQGEGDMAKVDEMKVQVVGDKLVMSQGEQRFVLKKL
jgi:hypothetical protein